MTISTELIVLAIMLLTALIGLIYRNMDTRVTAMETDVKKFQEANALAISALKDSVLTEIAGLRMLISAELKDTQTRFRDKDTCELQIRLHEERFSNIRSRFEELRLENKEYHESLVASITELHKTVTDIRECINMIQVGGDCE